MADNSEVKTRAACWSSLHAYSLAFACLLTGLLAGYFVRGSASVFASTKPPAPALGARQIGAPSSAAAASQQAMDLDKHAALLLQQLQADPHNAALITQLADFYFATRQLPQAAQYYEQALREKPKDTKVRVELGSVYFYSGDAERALAEFGRVLQDEPGNPDALFNLGAVKLQAKRDPAGAIEAWQKLLALNPNHPRRQEVEALIAKVRGAAVGSGKKD